MTKYMAACVGSVSSGQEANPFFRPRENRASAKKKKKIGGGRRGEEKETLADNPSILKTTHLQSRQNCHILTNGREAHESPVRRLFTLLIYNTKRDSCGFFNNISL